MIDNRYGQLGPHLPAKVSHQPMTIHRPTDVQNWKPSLIGQCEPSCVRHATTQASSPTQFLPTMDGVGESHGEQHSHNQCMSPCSHNS